MLQEQGVYEKFDELGSRLEEGIRDAAHTYKIPVTINRLKGAMTLYFTDEKVTNYEGAENSDGEQFAAFFKHMLQRGINLAPSKFEAWFLTTAHTIEDIEQTITAVEDSFHAMTRG